MGSAVIRGLRRLAEATGQLKNVRRKGWVDRGVPEAESVADHSYRVAVLAWAVARARGLDADRAVKIALVHDLAEAETGDETPFDDLLRRAERSGQAFDATQFEREPPVDEARRVAKHAREARVMEDLADSLATELGDELRGLWREYDEQATDEARLVKDLDRVETVLQAEAYRATRPGLPIGSFRAELARRRLPPDLAELV